MSLFFKRLLPLTIAVIIVTLASASGFLIGSYYNSNNELQKVLYTASAMLIFGSLLGGIIKILLEDLSKNRQRREDNANFVTNILYDLKGVYERVGRVRIIIPAHKSAKTYGDEMRALIEAGVTLRNINRAMCRRVEGIKEKERKYFISSVEVMDNYLIKLTDEFKDKYKNLSNHQRIYEHQVKERMMKKQENVELNSVFVNESVWEKLKELKELMGLIDDSNKSPYKVEFENQLNEASKILRNALRNILGEKEEK